MRTILAEFNGSMERIYNNFYFSFLSLNFLNQRPFSHDVVLNANMSQNIMTALSLNSCDQDTVDEYGNSVRRHFLNDQVIAYERYSMLMIASHNNEQSHIDPCEISDRTLGAHLFEQQPNVYQDDEKRFLIQLRRFRNSIVHYNGKYSATNELDYTFGTENYNSVGREGQNISIEFNNLLWTYNKLIQTVRDGNSNYFSHYTT